MILKFRICIFEIDKIGHDYFCNAKKSAKIDFFKSAERSKMATPEGTRACCQIVLTSARDFNWAVALPYSDENTIDRIKSA